MIGRDGEDREGHWYIILDRLEVSAGAIPVHLLPYTMPPKTKEECTGYRWVKKGTIITVMSSYTMDGRAFYGVFVGDEKYYHHIYAHELHISTIPVKRTQP